ncbi:MAG: alcohol dehydrogenase catalytic domain-containing protein [Burkholderiaceae bacterium]
MKIIRLASYGEPDQVARCVEQPDPAAPSPGEALFDVLAFPINPADLAFCRGQYRLRPPLPTTPGAECVGRVTAIGEGSNTCRSATWSSTCSARTGPASGAATRSI